MGHFCEAASVLLCFGQCSCCVPSLQPYRWDALPGLCACILIDSNQPSYSVLCWACCSLIWLIKHIIAKKKKKRFEINCRNLFRCAGCSFSLLSDLRSLFTEKPILSMCISLLNCYCHKGPLACTVHVLHWDLRWAQRHFPPSAEQCENRLLLKLCTHYSAPWSSNIGNN